MDTDVEKQKLEDEKRNVQVWLKNPITVALLQDNLEEQEKAINLLTNVPVTNIETFFAHFEVVGHLRGLRQGLATVPSMLAEIEAKLKEIENDN